MAARSLHCVDCAYVAFLDEFCLHYCPPTDGDKHHAFDAYDGSSGMLCTRMVIEDGDGVECGLPADHDVHTVSAKG